MNSILNQVNALLTSFAQWVGQQWGILENKKMDKTVFDSFVSDSLPAVVGDAINNNQTIINQGNAISDLNAAVSNIPIFVDPIAFAVGEVKEITTALKIALNVNLTDALKDGRYELSFLTDGVLTIGTTNVDVKVGDVLLVKTFNDAVISYNFKDTAHPDTAITGNLVTLQDLIDSFTIGATSPN